MLRIVQRRVSECWTCCNNYLAPTLLRQNKWFRKRENVEVGDLALELNSSRKRSKWEIALIADTYPGNDEMVRKVRIKTLNGEYDRPIHRLCLIVTKQELSGNEQ